MEETTDTEQPEALFPDGPALLYVFSPEAVMLREATRTVMRIDVGHGPVAGGLLSGEEARRERMLLRALLNQALWLLGPEENEG